MKRILIAGAIAFAAGGQALAADLPPPVAPPPRAPATYIPAPPPYLWTGLYVGINGGYGFGSITGNATGTSFNTNGFLGGATVGGNYQIGGFVFGLEGDFDYSSISTTTPAGIGGSNPGGPGASYTSKWLGTVRGRAGWAWDRVLFFGTAGGAFAPANFGSVAASGAFPAFPGGSTTMSGWTAGGGVEFAITPNWSAKAEYLYVNFPSPSLGIGSGFKATENVVRGGVNYKFTWW
jgi:outer membrane immunogenic protein